MSSEEKVCIIKNVTSAVQGERVCSTRRGSICSRKRRLCRVRREYTVSEGLHVQQRNSLHSARRKCAVSRMSHLQYKEGHVCCKRRRLSSVRIKLCSVRRE